MSHFIISHGLRALASPRFMQLTRAGIQFGTVTFFLPQHCLQLREAASNGGGKPDCNAAEVENYLWQLFSKNGLLGWPYGHESMAPALVCHPSCVHVRVVGGSTDPSSQLPHL